MKLRRYSRATMGCVGLVVLLSACGVRAGEPTAPVVDEAPFGGLVQCGDMPYVGVFRGFTDEGLVTEKDTQRWRSWI